MNHSLENHTNSVLGESSSQRPRIPISGKIRAGIMVLTSAVASNPQAQKIYQDGVKSGLSWDVIGRAIKTTLNSDKSCLRPFNVPYFTARRSDFALPEIADILMKLYGEDKGDGMRLYRFPVIFPVDEILMVLPHGLNHYTRSERVHWSDYLPDGTRVCTEYAPVEINDKTKRVTRTFGGRATQLRELNEGKCIPEQCPEYQANPQKCKLSGQFVFYVPGIPGSSPVSITTNSFYSMDPAFKKLQRIARGRGGIAGTMDGDPFFFITKKQEEVSMIDKDGKPKKVKQWIIVLEDNLDMSRVFQVTEQKLLEGGAQATNILEAPANDEPEFDSSDEDDPPAAPIEPENPLKAIRTQVLQGLKAVGIKPVQFNIYAMNTWGENWNKNASTYQLANSILNMIADGDDNKRQEIMNATPSKPIEAAQ